MSEFIYDYNECEAAMCLWEECLRRRVLNDEEMFDWLAGGEGCASARGMCIEFAKDIERSYNVAKAFGYDTLFDWEFVPFWADLAMEITVFSDLTPNWLNYIGYKAAEYERERWT